MPEKPDDAVARLRASTREKVKSWNPRVEVMQEDLRVILARLDAAEKGRDEAIKLKPKRGKLMRVKAWVVINGRMVYLSTTRIKKKWAAKEVFREAGEIVVPCVVTYWLPEKAKRS